MPGSDPSSDGSKAPADEDADAGGDDAAAASTDQAADQTADADGDATDTAAATDASAATADDSGNGDGDASPAVTGEYAGWQDPFTTPYPGYFNPYFPAAWDSSYAYPGFGGFDPNYYGWGRRFW